MLDLVRRPKAAAAAMAHIEAKKAAASSPLLPEKKIWQAVQCLRRDSSPFGTTSVLIRSQGSYAEPALLAALSDPRFLGTPPASDHFMDEGPAVTAIQLLGEIGTRESLPTMFRLLSSDDDDLADAALSSLLGLAQTEDFPRVAEVVASLDASEVDQILTPIHNRFHKRPPTAEEAAFFWSLIPHADHGPQQLSHDVVRTLASIDRNRVVSLMQSWLQSDDPLIVSACANLLSSTETQIELRNFSSVLNKIESQKLHAKVLMSSASKAGDNSAVWMSHWKCEVECGTVGDSLSESIRVSTLLDAIAIHLGHSSIFHAVGYQVPSDELSAPVRDIKLVMRAMSEIQNGGMLQFFVNSTGPSWRTTAAAIERNGLGKCGDVIRNAAEVIGLSQQDTDRSSIQKRLAILTEKQEAQLKTLTTKFYEMDEQLTLAIARYIEHHRDWFTAGPASTM